MSALAVGATGKVGITVGDEVSALAVGATGKVGITVGDEEKMIAGTLEVVAIGVGVGVGTFEVAEVGSVHCCAENLPVL